MKILCVIDSLGSGGAQRQIVNLAIAFKEKGHNVSFLVYHSDPFYYKVLNEQNIAVIEVLEPSYFKRLLKMRKAIRSGNYDSVLSFLEAANFIATVSGFPFRKWRLVVGERSANPSISTSNKLRFYRLFHLFVDAVVANSHENIKLVEKANPLLSNKKLNVIYNIIDFDKWQPKSDNYVFRKAGKFNLIVVASHQYLKNLDGLVEAVNLLSTDEKKQLIVNWYGGSSQDNSRTSAEEKIKMYCLNDNFKFHSPILDIQIQVNQADALGLFSFYEGLPNVVCEAMVGAKPIISSSVSDIPLLLDKDYVFNPKDIIDISNKIQKLLLLNEIQLEEIGVRNRLKAIDLFDKSVILNEYLLKLNKSKNK